jgi:hypothetical protein
LLLTTFLACGPKALPPPPAAWTEPAPAYTTATVSDVEGLAAELQAAAGSRRRIDSLDRLARRLLAAELQGTPTDLVVAEAMAHESGMPLPVFSFGVFDDKGKLLPFTVEDWGRSLPADERFVIGLAMAGGPKRTAAVVVAAFDTGSLAEAVPRRPQGPTALAIPWSSDGRPQAVRLDDGGLTMVELEVADGLGRAELPAPGPGGARVDVVEVTSAGLVDDTRLLLSFDQPAPDGRLPAAPPLAADGTPQERILAAIRGIRDGAAIDLADLGTPCVDWPTELDGAWLRADQECWSTTGVAWETAWESTAGRPWFREAVSDPRHDLIDVEVAEGLAVQLAGRFGRLEPEAGADAVAAALGEAWPGAQRVTPSNALFLSEQVDAFAVADDGGDAALDAVLNHPDLVGTDVQELFAFGATGDTLAELTDHLDVPFPPTRFAVGYVSARIDGAPVHAAIIIAAR